MTGGPEHICTLAFFIRGGLDERQDGLTSGGYFAALTQI
jgi:hypothetical protein